MKRIGLSIIGICLLSVMVSKQTFAATPQPQVVDKGYKQMVIGFTLASTAAYALHNYYRYYQHCPSDIKELNLPDVNAFADSPLMSIGLGKACSLHINYKNDNNIAKGLRGKTIILQEVFQTDVEHFVTNCSFNGASRYAPQTNCELTERQQLALTAEVLERGEWFSKLYNEQGAIPTLKGPMSEAVLLIFEQKELLTSYYNNKGKCPVNNAELAIAKPKELSGYFVESVSIEGCDIVARLKNQVNLFPELRGKALILRMLPTRQKGVYQWQCGSDADAKFLPNQCQVKQ